MSEALFNALNHLAESKIYETVTELEIINHGCIMEQDLDEGQSSCQKIEEFIGRFCYLKKINSFPTHGFNPFVNINQIHLEELVIQTPASNDELLIVSQFINSCDVKSLTFIGIQSEDVQYPEMQCPKSLESLTMKHLTTVDFGAFLSTLPQTIKYLKLNDINLLEDGLRTVIDCVEIFEELRVFHIENVECSRQDLFIKLGMALSVNQKYSLTEFSLSCNQITPETLQAICEYMSKMTILDKLILLNLRAISEYKLDDLVKAANKLVKIEKGGEEKHPGSTCCIEFSDYWLEFMIDTDKNEARDYLNENLNTRVFVKFIED